MTWLKVFGYRLRHVCKRRSAEQELAEEIKSHIEFQTQQYIDQGLTPEQARRAARLKFGSGTLAREDSRAVWSFEWLETLWRDLGYAIRTLRRSPGFTTVAVLSLALGIGANTTIFTAVNAILLRPPPFKDRERLVVVIEDRGSESDRYHRPKEAYISSWKQESKLLENLAAADPYGSMIALAGEGSAERVGISRGGADIFRVLGIEPILGRSFLPEDFRAGGTNWRAGGPNWADAVVLTHGLWVRRFGADPDVVGKTLSTPRMGNPVIIGVMPPGTRVFPWLRDIELWTAVDFSKNTSHSRWQSAVGRLKPGVTLEQIRQELELIARRFDETDGVQKGGGRIDVHRLQPWSSQEYTQALYLFFGAVGFVLLIACSNVANLCLGRALKRRKEMVTRAALGAARGRLVRQLLTESVLLSVTAGVAGLMLAYGGVRLFVYFTPEWYPPAHEYRLDLAVLAFTIGLSLLTGVVFGLAPALNAGRIHLNEALKESGRLGSGTRRRQGAPLVVIQLALAVVLLVGAGLMINTLLSLVQAEPGFKPGGLLAADMYLDGPMYKIRSQDGKRSVTPNVEIFYREVERRIEALPGVRSVGMSHRIPTRSTYRLPFRIVGEPEPPEDEEPRAAYSEVSSNYFQVAEIPLLKGRHFNQQDTPDSAGVAIVNKALTDKYFPDQESLGQVLHVLLEGPFNETKPRFAERPRTIVGVVGNSTWRRLNDNLVPEVFYPMSQHPWDYPGNPLLDLHTRKGILIRTDLEPVTLSRAVQKVIAEVDPHAVPTRIETMESNLAFTYREEQFWLRLLGLFSAVALLLAAIGLYGVISYSATQRTHEFGIRMALGAQRWNVLRMVLGDGLRLSLIGIGVGVAAALGLTQLLESQLYGVTPTDPATFTAVAAILLAVALLASYLPARSATKVDPIQALRYE